MIPAIRFTFPQTGESAVADLRTDDAPRTCKAVCAALPVCAVAHHASYSGSEGVVILPERLRVEPENATADVTTGDVGFTWFAAGSAYGVTSEFAEICWFYDVDARPSMHEGPVPVSVFARFRAGSEAFYARCRAMRRSGVTSLLVEPVDGTSAPIWTRYHDPGGEAPLAPPSAWLQGYELRGAINPVKRECRMLYGSPSKYQWEIGPAVPAAGQPVLGASLTVLADRRIVVALSADSGRLLVAIVSLDGGGEWPEPRDSGLRGSHPALIGLVDGRLALAYVDEAGPRVAVSADGGAPWRPVRMPEDTPHVSGGRVALNRPVLLPLADGRIACGACSPDADTPDWVTVVRPDQEDRYDGDGQDQDARGCVRGLADGVWEARSGDMPVRVEAGVHHDALPQPNVHGSGSVCGVRRDRRDSVPGCS